MSDFLIGGIDPGLSGGLVQIDLEGTVIKFMKMPRLDYKTKKSEIDIVSIDMFFNGSDFIGLERASAMPAYGKDGKEMRQGSAALFNFGKGYGEILGWLRLNYVDKYKLITPTVWKRHHNLLKQNKQASKDLAIKMAYNDFRATARSTTPHEGICEGFLIARYALDKIVKA